MCAPSLFRATSIGSECSITQLFNEKNAIHSGKIVSEELAKANDKAKELLSKMEVNLVRLNQVRWPSIHESRRQMRSRFVVLSRFSNTRNGRGYEFPPSLADRKRLLA